VEVTGPGFCLPAVFAAAEVPLPGSAATTWTAAAGTFTVHGASFVDHESPAHQVPPVAILDCLLGDRLVVNLDEGEAARFSAKPIAHNVDCVYAVSGLRKEVLQVAFIR